MRLKKGSKVEVLNTRDSPYGSWWSAVIISGNGHYYQVIYDVHPDHLNDTIIERIPRKNLRPCPPPQCPKKWSEGDFVEVFHCGSWKYCIVEDVAGCDYYFVQLHDSSEKFKAHNSSFRLPRIWKDSKWVSMQKNVGSHSYSFWEHFFLYFFMIFFRQVDLFMCLCDIAFICKDYDFF